MSALKELLDGHLDMNSALREAIIEAVEADTARLAHKASEIGYTYGALGRDFEYVHKNVATMLEEAR